jgi:hypothetical protein
MGWFGRHKRHGAVLALIALALQIVVAFDHVHLPGLLHNSRLALTQHTATNQTAPHAPAQFPSDPDGYCAVCASILLASSTFAATPPQLPVPAKYHRVEHWPSTAVTLATSPRLAFRSRAPPAA